MCDCAPGQPCHGEVLVQMLAAASMPPPPVCAEAPRPHQRRAKQHRSAISQLSGAAAILASAASVTPARAVPVRWTQTALHRGFAKLFPDDWLRNVPFPQLEDLVN
eukprot:1783816-Amphidinium_carterae.1